MKINKLGALLVAACVVIIVLLVIIFHQSSGGGSTVTQQNASSTTSAASSTGTTASTTSNTVAEKPKTPAKTVTAAPVVPAPAPIYFINPVANDTLTIGTDNPIVWNRAGGISGQIELINVNTQAVAGVIIPQVGPDQTSYTWNTRDLLLSRTSPFKQDVVPGTYEMRLIYDGNGLKPITSASFMIMN